MQVNQNIPLSPSFLKQCSASHSCGYLYLFRETFVLRNIPQSMVYSVKCFTGVKETLKHTTIKRSVQVNNFF